MIKESEKPLIIAGGGSHYSGALETLKKFVHKTHIPISETFAGKGALRFDDPHQLGAVGATGTPGANQISEEADLIIGLGTRYSDFTTSSKTAFQNPNVKFVNINITEFDAAKHGGLMLQGDAKAVLEELMSLLEDYRVSEDYQNRVAQYNNSWEEKVSEIYNYRHNNQLSQGEIIGAVNNFADDNDVVLCAAGSLPGDLHKLWRTKSNKSFHLEYGFSCMGYEIAGGLGAKMADPSREIYVMVGDGSYLMLSQEIVTSIQEDYKLTIVLIDNDGYKSIGSLSRSLGSEGFGTRYLFRNQNSQRIDGDETSSNATLPINLAENARSLGAHVIECNDYQSLTNALKDAKAIDKTTVIYTTCDRYQGVDGYGWWEVPIAQVSEMKTVDEAKMENSEMKKKQRLHY